jgi:hypothetical protein
MKGLSFLCIAAVGICLAGTLGVAKADEKKAVPDGTIELESKSVAAGVGFSWGKGVLHHKGKTYDLNVDGLTVGSVGASSIQASGKVFHLSKLSDFDGNYTAVVGGATVGGGGGGLAMKNQHGVVIEMVATTQGVSLTAGVSGVKLSIKQ